MQGYLPGKNLALSVLKRLCVRFLMLPEAVVGTRAVIKIVGKFAREVGTMCR